jgi:hypothetical protein
MKKSTRKEADLASLVNSPDFDEEAFEKEYFPEGSYEEALKRGDVRVSDGKGNWQKIEPSIRVTLNLSPVIRKRAESLDAYLSMGYQNVLKAAMLLGIKELEGKAAAAR